VGYEQDDTLVYCDSQSAIHLEKTKNFDIRYNFIRDIGGEGEVALEKISTKKNLTDMLTKSLPVAKFKLCLDLLNVRER